MGSKPALTADWDRVTAWLDAEYPDVRSIDVDTLRQWQSAAATSNRALPLLLDTRSAAEFAVSFIPGAQHAPTVAVARDLLRVAPDRPVVVYCAVAVRSARLARALTEAGERDVFNLRGSIFAWANRGLPLAGAAGPAQRVHGYDAHWQQLLAPTLRLLD